MNVDLSPDLEALIQRMVASGRYDNPSEVVCDALRLLGTRDRLRESHASMLRTALAEGLAARARSHARLHYSWEALGKELERVALEVGFPPVAH